VRDLVEKHHCSLLYLPAYAPDYNPIELLFSNIKVFVKQLRPLSLPELIQAFVDAVLSVTSDDAKNTFEHCGYVVQ
jgi:transposase